MVQESHKPDNVLLIGRGHVYHNADSSLKLARFQKYCITHFLGYNDILVPGNANSAKNICDNFFFGLRNL